MKSVLVSGFFNPNDKQVFDNDINFPPLILLIIDLICMKVLNLSPIY